MHKLLKTVLLLIPTYFYFFTSTTFASNIEKEIKTQPIDFKSLTLNEQSNKDNQTALYADQRFFYIGAEFGLAKSVKKKFLDKSSNATLSIAHSFISSVTLGYSFYPQMAIEFSASYKPNYKLRFTTPETPLGNEVIPITSKQTKAIAETYLINLVYNLKNFGGFTPFFTGGVGLSRVKVKPTSLSYLGADFVKLNKTHNNCFAWQVGLGAAKDIIHNLSMTAAARLHVTHNAKIKYQTLNPNTNQFVSKPPIKKTIGIGEFSIGFIYKFPV